MTQQDITTRLRVIADADVHETWRDGTLDKHDLLKWEAIMEEAANEIEKLRAELDRVRMAHKSILNEVLYGGTDLSDDPDIDRIHDFAQVGLKDMLSPAHEPST